jgi:hypothetical protein
VKVLAIAAGFAVFVVLRFWERIRRMQAEVDQNGNFKHPSPLGDGLYLGDRGLRRSRSSGSCVSRRLVRGGDGRRDHADAWIFREFADGSRGLAAIHEARGLTRALDPGTKPRGNRLRRTHQLRRHQQEIAKMIGRALNEKRLAT